MRSKDNHSRFFERILFKKEWNKILQEIIDNCVDAFEPRLRRIIEVEGRHLERY